MDNSLNNACWILSGDVGESDLPLSLTFRQMFMFLFPLGAFCLNLGAFSYTGKPIIFQGDIQYEYICADVFMYVCM